MPEAKRQVAIYARVSTDKQAVDMQLNELRKFIKRSKWEVYQEYIDQATGANSSRPGYSAMMLDAKQKKFDVLLVWKLDRLGRSLKDLILTLDEMASLDIDFIAYDQQINTSTPVGKLTFQIIGAMAEFERAIMSERVKAGLNNARLKGKRLGRPPLPDSVKQKVFRLKKQGMSNKKISQGLNIAMGSVRKTLESLESPTNSKR